MNYERCIICQNDTTEALRCGTSSGADKSTLIKAYQSFIDNLEQFRNSGVTVNVLLPLSEANVENLMANNAKWHNNCRREIRPDKLERKLKKTQTADFAGPSASTLKRKRETNVFKLSDVCLFCNKPGNKKNVLHKFQKLDLTQQLRKKALILRDENVLLQLSLGDVVANQLKYHTHCFVSFNRRSEQSQVAHDDYECNETTGQSKILEEILSFVEQEMLSGKMYFPLKVLYEEMRRRAQLNKTPPMNRTRLKIAVLKRFGLILKEEIGFRNEVILVCSKAMKDIITTSLVSTSPSEDYRTLSKAALICRRELLKLRYDFEKDGFPSDCQKNSVSDQLKYLIGLILYGPSYEGDMENEQKTLSISQLITYNTKISQTHEPPLPVYLGLLIHSKFQNFNLINELNYLGLSINYNRVKYLEQKMGDSVSQLFNSEGIVCPAEMRSGLFTVAAVDNIDHNPSSRTSKDSFHGTAISLFQAKSNDHDGDKRNFPLMNNTPKKLKLPDQFINLPQLSGSLNSEPYVLESETLQTESEILSQNIKKEVEWAKQVSSRFDSNDILIDDSKLTWSAYHGRLLTKVEINISGLFPLFKESSSDPKMILHAMELVKTAVQYLNPEQIPVITGDQPVYAIMKKLQWSHESIRDIVIMLGGFHTEKHTAKAIGDILQESGWTEAIVEAGIASQGTADGILKALHVTKTRYAHQVTYVALQTLINEAHQESSPENDFDVWLHNNSKYPTFAFWLLVMQLEALLLMFVRAHREQNFDLYVTVLERLGALFFACDHYHYARWVPVHVNDMKRLPISVLEQFKLGRFTVNRSQHRFSSIAIDQAHEQLNKVLKSSGGVIGLTQNEISLLNWSLFAPEVKKRIEDFKMSSGYQDNQYVDCDYFHHDEMAKRQEDFLSDVKSLTDVIRNSGNPFLELDNELVNLQGHISEDKSSVSILLEKGQEQYETFVNEVLIEKSKPFASVIHKNNFLLFKAPKRKRKQPKQISMLRTNISILGQMYIATQTRSGDLDDFFAHECQEYPPSIATSVEKMYHSKKSDVLVCFQHEVDASETSDDYSNVPSNYQAVVWDGGALIYSLPPTAGLKTFDDYFQMRFMKLIRSELRKTLALHIVWDTYNEFSIKNEIRDDRGHGSRLKVGPNVRLPKEWSNFLRHSKNKQDLFKYFSEEAVSSLDGIQNDFYITAGENVSHVGHENNMPAKCDHEEADTKIVLHVLHAIKEGAQTVLVHTVDSDVVVILVHHFKKFADISEHCQVFISFGTGKDRRLIDIKKITAALGPVRSHALPLWYALTGSDSTSSLKGRSKKISFNAWKKSPDSVTEAMAKNMDNPFAQLDLEATDFKLLENLFILIYGGKNEQTINDLRKIIFCQKHQNPERLPPTQNALLHHCRRSIYQASIWACAHMAEIQPRDPCQYGWKKEDDRLLPVWINIPTVASACQVMIKCGCKQNCSKACSCVKKSLNCIALCKCPCKK